MILPVRRTRPAGMTLTELLVVLAIILLVSAATLPTALVALNEREVSEAASIVQANFSLTRDRAAAAGEPVGVRLMPDPDYSNPSGILASNRMLPLSPAPSYSEGRVIPVVEVWTLDNRPGSPEVRRLALYEAKFNGGVITAPTSWYYNIRQGDTLRIQGSSIEFSIVGPMTVGPAAGNPERFINRTLNENPTGTPEVSLPTSSTFERLYLLNRRDDSPNTGTVGSGYVDEAFDGANNNGDAFQDPGFNGIDDNGNNLVDEIDELILSNWRTGAQVYIPADAEFEIEEPVSQDFLYERHGTATGGQDPFLLLRSDSSAVQFANAISYNYSIARRPLPAPGARQISLPAGAVIDLTTTPLGLSSERSRVPIDPITGYVDLMVAPNGQVYQSTPYGASRILNDQFPFFFLWIAAREDLSEPFEPALSLPTRLPITRDAANAVLPSIYPKVLEGERRLVVVSPTTGHASVSEVTEFDATNINKPFEEATRFQQTGE